MKKYLADCIVYSFFLIWNLYIGLIIWTIWRVGEITLHEPIRWIINLEVGIASVLLVFSVWAWIWLVTSRFRR